MISFLEGIIEHASERAVLVNAGGIGYSVTVLPKVLNSVSKSSVKVNPSASSGQAPSAGLGQVAVGQKVRLFVHSQLNMREGTFDLYGFDKKQDLELFNLLLSVPGIGPRNAMNIMATIEPHHLKAAVMNEDRNYLRQVSGLGPKTAQRLIVELTSKIEYLDVGGETVDLGQESQALEALMALGYSQNQAQDVLKQVPGKTNNLQERVKEALKLLGRK